MALADSLRLRTGVWAPAVELNIRSSPSVLVKASTEVLRRQLGVAGYAPTLLAVGTIRRDLDQRSATTVRIRLRNGESGISYDLPGLLGAYPVLSCTLTLLLYFRAGDGTLETLTLFQGSVQAYTVERQYVEVVADELAVEKGVQFPVRQVMPDSMSYGTREGKQPEGQRGMVAPIFYGYFQTFALNATWQALADPSWLELFYPYCERWASMLGVKHPMVPLTYLADVHQWENDGTTPKTDSKRLLFACGDKDNTNNSAVLLHAEMPGAWNSWAVTEQRPMPSSSSTDRILWSGLYTWNDELDRAVQYLNDRSAYLSDAKYGTEDEAHTGGPVYTTQVGSGWYLNTDHTNLATAPSRVQTAWVQRLDPIWPKSGQSAPGYFTGRIAGVALLPEALDMIGGTTDGRTFGMSGTTNPMNALDFKDPSTYAVVANGQRLSITMPAVGPRLGDVLAVRMIVVRSGAATRVDASYRFHPDTGGLDVAPIAEFQCSVLGSPNQDVVRHNDSSGSVPQWFSWYVWHHQQRKPVGGSGGTHSVPQWVFAELGVSPPQAYAGTVVLWNGYDTETFNVHAVWMEVIYRDPITGMPEKVAYTDGGAYKRNEDAPHQNEDATYTSRPHETPGFMRGGGRHVHVTYRYSGNVRNPEAQPMGSQRLYACGVGPKHYSATPGTNTSDRWKPGRTGAADYSYPIHNPASIALHVIDKYLGQYSECEVGSGALGSFRDAMEYLETQAGGTWPAYRLSVVVNQRMSVRAFLDKLGDHCRSFIVRQRNVDGTVKWRMYVDSYNPASDFAANRWRSGEAIVTKDVFKVSADTSGLDAIRNAFVLRYGYHEPTGKYAYERVLNSDTTDLATDGTTYKTACATSESDYGGPYSSSGERRVEEIVELPWLWYDKVADVMLKYHCNLRRQRRMLVQLVGNQNLLDVMEGQTVYLEDAFVNYLGQYPGRLSGSTWSGHQWHVVSKDVALGAKGLQVELALLERVVTP